jgi:hypothetical protein
MTASRAMVVDAIGILFPAEARDRVLAMVDAYGSAPHERERERVQLAIVRLSEGDEAKLGYFLSVAKQDYRDVLFWADNPAEAKLDTPEKRRRVRELLQKLGIEPPAGLKE